MTVKKGEIIECTVSGLAFGGKGISRIDGMTVFIEAAAPGDRIKAQIFKRKKTFAQARIVEILTPSPARISPPCPYFGCCGGCKWQYLSYDVQLEYKRRHVEESLEHIGKIHDVRVYPAIPSKAVYGYRNKMEFSCSDRRWLMAHELGKDDVDMGFALGLHVPGTFHKVLDIDTCMLQPDTGNEILRDVKTYMKNSTLPAYGLKSQQGFWRFLTLRHSLNRNQWMVNIITSSENMDEVKPLAEELMNTCPGIVSVVNNITGRKSSVAVGEYEKQISGDSVIRDTIGSYEFEISANSFFQTNTGGAEKLYDTIRAYAELTGREHVLDLYCGTGAIAISLSDFAVKVTGMEIVESAIHDAKKNCDINNISNCEFILGDIKSQLKQLTGRPDVMIIDPPRTGMHPDVVKQVLAMGPGRIVYVSCNPATLARDLEMMKSDYDIIEAQPVDMFLHTYHIEAVVKMVGKR